MKKTRYQPRKIRGARGRKLTKRETGILIMIAKGLSNKEIAEELGLARQTIGNTVSRIYYKLRLERPEEPRVKAVLWALRKGIVSVGEEKEEEEEEKITWKPLSVIANG